MKRSFILILTAMVLSNCSKPEVTQPTRTHLVDAVFASGNIIAENEYLVTANTQGYVAESFQDEGDFVMAGTPLFHLSSEKQNAQLESALATYNDAYRQAQPDSPQLTQLNVQIRQAEQQLEIDKRNYERYTSLYASNAISLAELENKELQYEVAKNNLEIHKQSYQDTEAVLQLNLQNAEQQLNIQKETSRDYFLNASHSGQVLNIYQELGDFVNAGEPIAKVGGTEYLIQLFIAEQDIKYIETNQKVLVTLNTDLNQTHIAFIHRILPAFSVEDQSFIVEAKFIEPVEFAYPGTQLQANVIIQEVENTLVIPSPFLQEGNTVLLKSGEKVIVETGVETLEWTQILSGLDETDQLMIANN